MTAIPPVEIEPAVYRCNRWRRIFLSLAGPFFLLSALGLFTTASHATAAQAPLAFSFAAVIAAAGFYMIASAWRPRIVLDSTGIAVRGVFTERSALRTEIEGFRTVPSRYGSYRRLVLKGGCKPIAIASCFRTGDDFRAWFQDIPDLDKRDREALLARIEQHEELGATREERLGSLARARRFNVALMGAAVAAALGLNFGPAPWPGICAAILAAAPLLTVWLCRRSPLLYTAFKKKQDPRAETIHALLIAGFGMFFHLAPFHFLSVLPLLGGMVVLGLATTAAYFQVVRGGMGNKALFAVLFLAALYAYGAMTTLDVCFDGSGGQFHSAAVVGRHIARGRSTSYYLRLAPWGPVSSPQDVSVPLRLYRATAVGDTVCLNLHPGWLNAPWFRVAGCSASGFSAPPAPGF